MTTLGLPDDWQTYLLLGGVALGVILWGLKLYRKVSADGKITLDEVIDVVQSAEDKATETKEEVDAILAARKCSVCGGTGHDKRNCPDKEEASEEA